MNKDLPFRSHSEFHKSFCAEEGWNESRVMQLSPTHWSFLWLPISTAYLPPSVSLWLVSWSSLTSYFLWTKTTMKTVKVSYRNVLKLVISGELLGMTCTHRKFCRKFKNFGQRVSTKFVWSLSTASLQNSWVNSISSNLPLQCSSEAQALPGLKNPGDTLLILFSWREMNLESRRHKWNKNPICSK